MQQPDRFKRIVDKAIGRTTFGGWLPRYEVEQLLRRQHAVYVRLVKRHYQESMWDCRAHNLAIEAVLAALSRYKKGGTK